MSSLWEEAVTKRRTLKERTIDYAYRVLRSDVLDVYDWGLVTRAFIAGYRAAKRERKP